MEDNLMDREGYFPTRKISEVELGALERHLTEFKLDHTEQIDDLNQVEEPLILMTPSSYASPTKEFPVI